MYKIDKQFVCFIIGWPNVVEVLFLLYNNLSKLKNRHVEQACHLYNDRMIEFAFFSDYRRIRNRILLVVHTNTNYIRIWIWTVIITTLDPDGYGQMLYFLVVLPPCECSAVNTKQRRFCNRSKKFPRKNPTFFNVVTLKNIGIVNNVDGYVRETDKIFTPKNVDRFFRLPRIIYCYLTGCHTREFVFPLREHKRYSRLDQYTDTFDLPRLNTREYTYRKSSRGNL